MKLRRDNATKRKKENNARNEDNSNKKNDSKNYSERNIGTYYKLDLNTAYVFFFTNQCMRSFSRYSSIIYFIKLILIKYWPYQPLSYIYIYIYI